MSTPTENWLRKIKDRRARSRARRALKTRRPDRRLLLERFEDRAAAGSTLGSLPGLFGNEGFEFVRGPGTRDPLAELRRTAINAFAEPDVSSHSVGSGLGGTDLDSSRASYGQPGENTQSVPHFPAGFGAAHDIPQPQAGVGGFQFDVPFWRLDDTLGKGQGGGPSAPVLSAVYPLKNDGGGQLFVQGTVDTEGWTDAKGQLAFYVLRGDSATWVGQTTISKDPLGLHQIPGTPYLILDRRARFW